MTRRTSYTRYTTMRYDALGADAGPGTRATRGTEYSTLRDARLGRSGCVCAAACPDAARAPLGAGVRRYAEVCARYARATTAALSSGRTRAFTCQCVAAQPGSPQDAPSWSGLPKQLGHARPRAPMLGEPSFPRRYPGCLACSRRGRRPFEGHRPAARPPSQRHRGRPGSRGWRWHGAAVDGGGPRWCHPHRRPRQPCSDSRRHEQRRP